MRSSGLPDRDPLRAGGQRARRALLPRRRLGAGRAEGRRVPRRDGDRAPLPQGSLSCAGAGGGRRDPPPSTRKPTTIPPQLNSGSVLSSTSVSARKSAGSACEQRPDVHSSPSRVSSSPRRSPTFASRPHAAPLGRGHDLGAAVDVALVDLLDAEEIGRGLAARRCARARFRSSRRPPGAGRARGRPAGTSRRTPRRRPTSESTARSDELSHRRRQTRRRSEARRPGRRRSRSPRGRARRRCGAARAPSSRRSGRRTRRSDGRARRRRR